MASASPVVRNLQVLRLVAASLVLLAHVEHEAVGFGLPDAATALFPWRFGVDVFFVISGFVMYHNAQGGFGRPGAAWSFFRKRLARIVPLYWLATTAMLAALAAAGSIVSSAEFDPLHIVSSYLFLPYPGPDEGASPILSLGWTLNYEMLFYALFALALLLPKRVGPGALVALLVLLSAIHTLIPADWVQLQFWTAPLLLEFVAGMLLAMAYKARVRLNLLAAAAIVAAGLILIPSDPGQRWLEWGLPASLIVAAAALAPEPGYASAAGRLMLLGGDASYALYLTHLFTLHALAIACGALGFGYPAFIALGIAVSLAVAIGVHLAIDRPIQSRLKRGPNATLG